MSVGATQVLQIGDISADQWLAAHAQALGYKIELGKDRPGEYTLFTVYDGSPKGWGWNLSTHWHPTTYWRTSNLEAVRKAIEAGYPATDEVIASLHV
jgi:hypothetical protein